MFPLLLLGLLGVGALAATSGPRKGELRMLPEPQTDDTGRTYWIVQQWDGAAWSDFGRRYMGP